MKRVESIAIGVIIILGVIAASIAVYDLMTPPKSNLQTTSLPFVNQSVVDVIVPSLYRQQGSNSGNVPLNATQGETVSMVVNVYTTVSLTLKMTFDVISGGLNQTNAGTIAQSSSMVSATFDPDVLTISGAGQGTCNLTLHFSPVANLGDYNSVVSAVNVNDPSQVWGAVVQINIEG